MKNNVNITINNKKCSGCFACKDICPSNAIELEQAEDGFIYPSIDDTKCINCGLCLSTCPSFSSQNIETSSFKTYYFKSVDKEVKDSTSGGFFYEAAKNIINQNGVIYGSALVELKAKHIRVTSLDEIKQMQGSKYIQSDTANIYQQVAQDLLKGSLVLFSGTPCQCNALKLFLGIRNISFGKLYNIAIACHGVPSQFSFDAYIKNYIERIYSKQVKHYYFRNKSAGSNNIKVIFSDGSDLAMNRKDDPYNILFANNTSLRNSCVHCEAKHNISADILMADFWGIEHIDTSIEKPGSLILSFTNKGDELLKAYFGKNNILIKEEKSPNPHNQNPSLFHSVTRCSDTKNKAWYKNYFSSFKNEEKKAVSTTSLASKLLKQKDDTIYIVTIPDLLNYGNRLQNFALQTFLRENYPYQIYSLFKFGYGDRKRRIKNIIKDFVFYVRDIFTFLTVRSRKRFIARSFNRKYMRMKNYRTILGVKLLKNKAKYFIAGGDQVWNPEFPIFNYSTLYFAYPEQRLSYSASIGISVSEQAKKELANKTVDFVNISLREKGAMDIYKNHTSPRVDNNIDPVFLLTADEWRRSLNLKPISKRYIFVYHIGSKDDAFEKIVNQIQSERNLEVIYFSHSENNWNGTKYYKKNAKTFLNYLAEASLVITNSFHGFALSLVFNKENVVYTKSDNDMRFDSIKDILGITFKYSHNETCEINTYDWDLVNKNILSERKKSIMLFDELIK